MARTVLITGGTSGIGLAVAKLFLTAGDQVVLMGRDENRGLEALGELRELAGITEEKVCFIAGDVSKAEDCQRVAKEAAIWGGSLEVLINSAGIYMEKALADMTEEDMEQILAVNLKGTCMMTKYATEEMKKGVSGAIVNVSSDAGLQGNYLCSLYCASKGGVNLFTKAMALELAPYGIRVNSVCPGDVWTPLTERQISIYPEPGEVLKEMNALYPLGRIATDREIAEVIFFLASDKASFVNGAIWSVDGGLTA